MLPNEEKKLNGNDFENLIDKFKKQISDIELGIKDLDQFIKPAEIMCGKCNHPISKTTDINEKSRIQTQLKLECPKCGYINLIKKI